MKAVITIEEIDALSIDDLWELSMQLQTFADYAAKRAEVLAVNRMEEGEGGELENWDD
jgi:hypothetical protein